MTEYVYCADIPNWHAKHPRVLARVPEGHTIIWCGNDGVWVGLSV